MTSTLEQLKQYTIVVADTGDFESIHSFKPQDATTNPSLILKAAQKPEYRFIIDKVIDEQFKQPIDKIIDAILIAFGIEILNIVPGRVSTEVDARLSFDTQKTINKAHDIVKAYSEAGIDKSRILIKIASTWEGIEAARYLQSEGIACNMTLLFCQAQAIACADAKAQLISPFIGRILDWYKKNTGEIYTANTDPGVLSVRNIYKYYKCYGIQTEIMGASFRNMEEVIALAGCDLLTISPDLLKNLSDSNICITTDNAPLTAKIQQYTDKPSYHPPYTESEFRWALNENSMATEKLAEGIRLFAADTVKLEQWLLSLIDTKTAKI